VEILPCVGGCSTKRFGIAEQHRACVAGAEERNSEKLARAGIRHVKKALVSGTSGDATRREVATTVVEKVQPCRVESPDGRSSPRACVALRSTTREIRRAGLKAPKSVRR
jgi:hypothetical protein